MAATPFQIKFLPPMGSDVVGRSCWSEKPEAVFSITPSQQNFQIKYKMSDFSVSLGCGDYPTNELDDTQTNIGYTETEEEIQEKIAKGYIKDSAGQWYDPTNYIDCYYADW